MSSTSDSVVFRLMRRSSAALCICSGAHPELVRANIPGWVAPSLCGPLPERLRARAEALAARQLQLAEDLSRAIAAARQELRLAERISAHALDRSTPAFLDASF